VGVNVSTPAIAYGEVFVNSEDPGFGLWAFNATTGALAWRNQQPGESESTVTVANGVVFDIAETGELMMFNSATGAFLGLIADPAGQPFNPFFGAQAAVVNGTVYVPTAACILSSCASPDRVDTFRLP
jgi:outer membrane protein assembly factor BamB